MLKMALNQVVSGENLSREQARQVMAAIMSGSASEAQIGGLLAALRMKGETVDEIAGFAEAMRSYSLRISCGNKGALDTCGTGGDRKGTFNVSTTAAFVVAGAGVVVAKHGNHGATSSCGSADVLKELGVSLELSPQAVATALNTLNVAFLYAPSFHPAMKYAGKPRRELGFRTVFNVLGPLTNPVGAECQLLGVYERALTEKIADVLLRLGVKRAMVVHGLDGLDEISTAAPTQVSEVINGRVRTYLLEPADYGIRLGTMEDYQGGSPKANAATLLEILQGKKDVKRDIVLVNAAAALVVADKAENIRDGLVVAANSIDSGAALAKFEALKAYSQQHKGA
ncbi:MAG: trpD [Firmicutes bacterium]|nr:trpD [Bacillota bacterium]